MELQALQAFVKVVQTGSFTRAAEAMNTQKAHLSRVVSQMEKELAVRLLARTTRSLSLTEDGREFFERAVGILASVEEARLAMQQTQGEPRGQLRLTCGVEFGLVAVSGWVADYLARFPQVQVDADFTNRVVDIVHEGFDLAVRVGPLSDSSLAARRLGTLSYGLYASVDYVRRQGQPAHPAELAQHSTIAFTGGGHQGAWVLRRDDESQQVPLQPRLRVNNSLAARDAVLRGLGIALLPRLIVEDGEFSSRLHRVLADWSAPQIPVHAVFASARYLAPKVREFIDLALWRFNAGGPGVHQ